MAKKKTAGPQRVSKNAQRKDRMKKELNSVTDLQHQVDEFEGDLKKLQKFTELPLSKPTMKGLAGSHFVDLRDIQRLSILPALQGHDILAAAHTGSGKTLAFLIPILEYLFRENWTDLDGLGVMILSPTRELAVQTFDVLRKIGRFHQFSAGLVVGGKDAQTESERLGRINILVGTPGRIVHHMHRSENFDTSNLRILVLDEADRILDQGFKKDVDSILNGLPTERQSMLVSATQTKRIKDLARLSLKDPMYISPHNTELITTPKELEQFYIISEVDEKLNNLFAFIKSHLKSKILVFFSSRKQVRFAFETFKQMQPGMPLIQLTGTLKQTARLESIDRFRSMKHACLITTDVAARGIDVAGIEWVIQVDVAEDVDTYIHRVGRSARNEKKGRSLLFLTPNEEPGFVNALQARNITINKQNVRQNRKKDITIELQKMCYEDPEIKVLGQKALQSYVRSIHVRPNPEYFNYTVKDVPMEKFAKSFGLPSVPNVQRLEKLKESKARKNQSRDLLKITKGTADDEDKPVRTKYDRMFGRTNQGVLSTEYQELQRGGFGAVGDDHDDEEDSDGEDFMAKKSSGVHEAMAAEELVDMNKPESKRAAKRALSKKQAVKEKSGGQKLLFDDEGVGHQLYEFEDEEDFKAAGDAEQQKREYLSKEAEVMERDDVEDKAIAKEKRQEKKRKRQEAERRRDEEGGGGVQVMLPSDNESESSEPETKKPRWFHQQSEDEDDNVLHVDEPETLEDLEALSSKLISRK